jgi:outer membrane receptor protein involved in Fe transport
LAYTYTESTFTTPSGTQRRGLVPRHQFGLDSNYCLFKKWTIGCGVTIVADREDKFTSGLDLENFFTARVYSRYEHNDHFAIFGRVENVTDTDYEYSTKVPALPIGFYGGVELKF